MPRAKIAAPEIGFLFDIKYNPKTLQPSIKMVICELCILPIKKRREKIKTNKIKSPFCIQGFYLQTLLFTKRK